MNKYPTVTFRISNQLLEALDNVAKSRQVSRSEVITVAIFREIVDHIDKTVKQ